MPEPFFSIIIVCRNPGRQIRTALESIWKQYEANYEIVVVDGASTDGTFEWLEQQKARLDALLSEPDRGVYEAMNKALRLARGQWLIFVGADDVLAEPELLSRVRAAIGTADRGLFCGEAAYSDGRVWRAPSKPSVLRRNFLHHQACIYHRSVFANCAYDETLSLQADYDLNLRLWVTGIHPQPLPIRIAVCASGGLSDRGYWKNYREEIRIRHRYAPSWRCWIWDAGSILRYFRKKILRSTAQKRPE